MGIYEYPHTNLNQPNLDYVCKKIGDIERTADAVDTAKTSAVSAKNAAENAAAAALLSETAAAGAATSAEGAKAAAETAATSASAAAESANNTKTQIVNKLELFDDEHEIIMRDSYAGVFNENDEHFIEIPKNGTQLEYSIRDTSHSADVTEETENGELILFTDFLKCKKHLIIDGHKASDIYYIYFYTKTDGEYVINWDILKTNNSGGYRNRCTNAVKHEIYELPDNTYIKIGVISGNPHFYTWDGVNVGESFNADIVKITSGGSIQVSSSDHVYTTFIPANSKIIWLNDPNIKLQPIVGLKADGSTTSIYAGANISNFTFDVSDDYIGYYVAFRALGDAPYNFHNSLDGIFYCIVDDHEAVKVNAPVINVLKNAEKVNALEWEPKANLLLERKTNGTTINFKAQHKYHGIPYSVSWTRPSVVGWHISPHTFINAVNDVNSVLYNEYVEHSDGSAGTYYGSVCSTYMSMIFGFPCLNTNAGFIYSPEIVNRITRSVPLGEIWSDGGHCIAPLEIGWTPENSNIRVAESLRPLTTITNRFNTTVRELAHYGHYNGDNYFKDYFYTATHKRQTNSLADVPYADFDNAVLVNGSARPYRGDKCVYTSSDSEIIINLVGVNINTLYIKHDGVTTNIATAGATAINVKDYMTTDGIYELYTNISDTVESFEFVNVEPISVTITDNNIAFSDDEFWYANCYVTGNEYLSRSAEHANVEKREDGDYSGWFANGQSITGVKAVFCKGVYGAYIRPIAI